MRVIWNTIVLPRNHRSLNTLEVHNLFENFLIDIGKLFCPIQELLLDLIRQFYGNVIAAVVNVLKLWHGNVNHLYHHLV